MHALLLLLRQLWAIALCLCLWADQTHAANGCPGVHLMLRRRELKVAHGRARVVVKVKNQGATAVTNSVFKLGLSAAAASATTTNPSTGAVAGITVKKAAMRPRRSGTEFVATGPSLFWSGVDIPAGKTQSFVIRLKVSSCAPANVTVEALLYQIGANGEIICDERATAKVSEPIGVPESKRVNMKGLMQSMPQLCLRLYLSVCTHAPHHRSCLLPRSRRLVSGARPCRRARRRRRGPITSRSTARSSGAWRVESWPPSVVVDSITAIATAR